ncbi:EamA family transporter [Mycobacterium sp. BMJ-28]
MNRVSATLCAASGALLWGTLGPVVSAWSRMGSEATALARSAVAAVTLGLLAWGGITAKGLLRDHWRALLTGGVGLAGFQYAYFSAVAQAGVAVSTVISIGVAPILTGVWTWVTSRRLSAAWVLATALACAGLALLVLGAGMGTLSATGIACSVSAAACFSAQALAIESIEPRWPTSASLAWMFAIASAIMLPTGGFALASSWHVGLGEASAVLYLGVVTAGVAYWLFSRGVQVIGAPAAVTISVLEPAGALLLAVVFLGEHQTPLQWLGTALLIGCIPIIARSARAAGTAGAVPVGRLSG